MIAGQYPGHVQELRLPTGAPNRKGGFGRDFPLRTGSSGFPSVAKILGHPTSRRSEIVDWSKAAAAGTWKGYPFRCIDTDYSHRLLRIPLLPAAAEQSGSSLWRSTDCMPAFALRLSMYPH